MHFLILCSNLLKIKLEENELFYNSAVMNERDTTIINHHVSTNISMRSTYMIYTRVTIVNRANFLTGGKNNIFYSGTLIPTVKTLEGNTTPRDFLKRRIQKETELWEQYGPLNTFSWSWQLSLYLLTSAPTHRSSWWHWSLTKLRWTLREERGHFSIG